MQNEEVEYVPQEDYKDTLNIMKAEEFREEQENKFIQRIFQALKRRQPDKGDRHYQYVLYCKVFKGLMLTRLQLDAFEENLENVYIGMLLQTHFQAMKEYQIVVREEREEKTSQVQKRVKTKCAR